jgi:hypothetical protein
LLGLLDATEPKEHLALELRELRDDDGVGTERLGDVGEACLRCAGAEACGGAKLGIDPSGGRRRAHRDERRCTLGGWWTRRFVAKAHHRCDRNRRASERGERVDDNARRRGRRLRSL